MPRFGTLRYDIDGSGTIEEEEMVKIMQVWLTRTLGGMGHYEVIRSNSLFLFLLPIPFISQGRPLSLQASSC